jgi:glycosyltransferase involved in cell wall biosynthesis
VRVLHLSTEDISGGAARAAARLHAGLLRLGHDSKMLVAQRSSDDETVLSMARELSVYKSLARAADRLRMSRELAPYRKSRPAGLDRFSEERSSFAVDLVGGVPEAEVLNLHWVAGFVDYAKFFKCFGKKAPVVWTLHDMNVFTGGCHYDEGCGKYMASCGACPQLGSRDENDLSRAVWRRKKKVFERLDSENLHIVADSRWLAGEAKRSSLLQKFPVETIHYGLDTAIFTPRDKSQVRGALGIAADARVVMFGAELLSIRRKGLATLVEALRGVRGEEKLLLLSVGRRMPELDAAIPQIHFGHVNSDFFLSLLYSAADVFVIPSLQEAFGQTALESLACGTAVVGSDVGGIPEIVQDGVTGCLVPPGVASDLRAAIMKLLNEPEKRAEMAKNGVRLVLEKHTLEAQARRYETLYHRIIENRRMTTGSGSRRLWVPPSR